jgi:nicotinate dehydrogenase subunit A
MGTLRFVELTVNGTAHALEVDPRVPLLQVLRNDLGLNGPKYGCGLGQCGACLVLLDGKAARSCVLPVAAAAAHRVTTLEGLSAAAQGRAAQGRAADGLGEDGLGEDGLGEDGRRAVGRPADTRRDQLHAVQRAFIAKQGAQCGYCLNGMIMRTVALLERIPAPSERQIREALDHNLCRCGAHEEILQSVRHAVTLMAQEIFTEPEQ